MRLEPASPHRAPRDDRDSPPAVNRAGPWTWLAGLVALACAANALAFAWLAAMPLPASDAWYFLTAFVAPAVDGSLGLEHFFVQRGGDDHAQPLQKLVLLAHLHAADLDFRIEALVGVLAALGTCALLGALLLRHAGTARERRMAALGAGMVALLGLSLNSTGIYTWPLVTMGWMLVLVAVLYWALLSRPAGRPRGDWRVATAGTFAMAMVLDEMAFPVVIALVLARLVYEGRGAARAANLAVAGGLMVGLVLARMAIGALSPTAAAGPGSLQAALGRIDAWSDLATLVGGPLADALVHASHRAAGPFADGAAVGLIVLAVLAHAAYWWRVLVSRALPERTTGIVSIALMLLSYATVAGVLLSRVGEYGVDYVHQPRYVLFYQLGLVAWVLMFAAPRAIASAPSPARAPAPAGEAAWKVLFVAILGLQAWLSMLAWQSLPYLTAYTRGAAGTMEALASNPAVLPAQGCPDILTVCAAPPAKRAEALALLVDHELNLFSASFRQRHRLPLLDETSPEFALTAEENAACSNAFVDWGPREITLGVPFNQQPDGSLAYWATLAPGLPEFWLMAGAGGPRLPFARTDGLMTLQHGPELEAMVAAGGPVRLHLKCMGGPSSTLEIPVR